MTIETRTGRVTMKRSASNGGDYTLSGTIYADTWAIHPMPDWSTPTKKNAYQITNYRSGLSATCLKNLSQGIANRAGLLLSELNDPVWQSDNPNSGAAINGIDQLKNAIAWAIAEKELTRREREMSEGKIICTDCDQAIDAGMETNINDDTVVCENCRDSYFCCEECEEYKPEDESNPATKISNRRPIVIDVCDECLDDTYFRCKSCRCYFHGSLGHSGPNDQDTYCETCFYDAFSNCQNCGEVVHNDDTYYNNSDNGPFCDSCYSEQKSSDSINDYSYKPDPVFHHAVKKGKGKKRKATTILYGDRSPRSVEFFGTETETSCTNVDDSKLGGIADRYLDLVANKGLSNFLYLKEDGSVDGFEIVTHPFSWDWFKAEGEKFTSTFKMLSDAGLRSYQAEQSCGMHVHIDNNSFGDGMVLYKFMQLLYMDHAWTLKVSRREDHDLRSWANLTQYQDKATALHARKTQITGIANRPVFCLLGQSAQGKRANYLHKPFSWSRGAINICPKHTVEVRIFKGTLSPTGYARNLEFCHAAIQYARRECIKGISPENFSKYVFDHAKSYKNLATFLSSDRFTGDQNEGAS